jgi:hypothetical protein
MRRLNIALFVLLAFAFSALMQYKPSFCYAVTAEESLRKPFRLELPEIGATITEAEARIPRSNLHLIRLRVLKPYADTIDFGKIYTTINGEAAGTIQRKNADNNGYVVTCDLDLKQRFRLKPGKNVIEISAVDHSGRSYYASYVLLASETGGGSAIIAKAASIEYGQVNEGDDREPPTVNIIEPKAAIPLTGDSGTARVRGVVADNSGKVASVKVNGQSAPLSAVTGERALVVTSTAKQMPGQKAFDYTVAIPAGVSSVTVEAKDYAGNVTRVLVPVQRREALVSPQFKGRKFAIIIGVSLYKYHDGGLNDLGYADADARAIRDFLQRREGGGFSPSDVLYLENAQATINAVRQAMSSFLAKAGRDDLLFIFLASHGAPDPYDPSKLYFLLHDTKVADMANTALPMRELQEELEARVRAERVVVLIDTCHSAGLSGKQIVGTRALENNLVNLYATKLYKEEGRAVLTSSDVSEVSQESAQWGGGHGVFTYALLEAFRGAADTNLDRLITAGELFNYVRDRVALETSFQQNPTALPGLNADLTLAAVAKR